MKDKFLPCPFCPEDEAEAAPPILNQTKKKHFDKPHFTVQCTNCGCEPDFCIETADEAIDRWNTREVVAETAAAIIGFNSAKKRIIELIEMLHVRPGEKAK